MLGKFVLFQHVLGPNFMLLGPNFKTMSGNCWSESWHLAGKALRGHHKDDASPGEDCVEPHNTCWPHSGTCEFGASDRCPWHVRWHHSTWLQCECKAWLPLSLINRLGGFVFGLILLQHVAAKSFRIWLRWSRTSATFCTVGTTHIGSPSLWGFLRREIDPFHLFPSNTWMVSQKASFVFPLLASWTALFPSSKFFG